MKIEIGVKCLVTDHLFPKHSIAENNKTLHHPSMLQFYTFFSY